MINFNDFKSIKIRKNRPNHFNVWVQRRNSNLDRFHWGLTTAQVVNILIYDVPVWVRIRLIEILLSANSTYGQYFEVQNGQRPSRQRY